MTAAPVPGPDGPGARYCTAPLALGEDDCLRLAQWVWQPDPDTTVLLCNRHAEPFEPLAREVQR